MGAQGISRRLRAGVGAAGLAGLQVLGWYGCGGGSSAQSTNDGGREEDSGSDGTTDSSTADVSPGPDAHDGSLGPDSAAASDAPGDSTSTDAPSGDSGVADSGPTDSGPTDSGSGGSPDASDGAVPATYYDITVAANWTTDPFPAPALDPNGEAGGTFDGRYVYFAPSAGSSVTRYDTQGAFSGTGSGSSWTNFDVSTVPGGHKAFAGAVFDGRYVYLVPTLSGVVVRYDTQSSFAFTSASAWSTFDTTQLTPSPTKYKGATFDGRYVYFSPSGGAVGARYDTHGTFTVASSSAWVTYAVGVTCTGAVFDGTAVYYASTVPTLPRYDTTTGNFTASGSWSSFNTTLVAGNDAGAAGFSGAAFDGQYAYFLPGNNPMLRYDTTLPFGSASSWFALPLDSVLPAGTNLQLATFDGRYVYFGSYSRLVARVDTQGAVNASTSWADATNTLGVPEALVFDGAYVYVPARGNVLRFHARSPAAMPNLPAFHGSFF